MADRPLTVLLVEDNPGDARLIAEMLREGGGDRYRLEHVDRLAPALARLSQGGIDVLLLDLSLPDTQGFETFRRAHEHAPDVPVVVLTGLDDQEVSRRAVQEGAQDYIPKGDVNAHGLVRSLLYAIERARGEVDRARLLAREQEAHLEAEAERARIQAILDSAGHGIMFIDAANGRLTANPAAELLFGRALLPDGGMEQYLGQVCRPSGEPLPLDELPLSRGLRGAGSQGEELVLRRPGGSEVPVLCSSASVRDASGTVTGAVAVFQDISPIKELERLREEWTSVIAHDLRQPVAAISFYAQALDLIAAGDQALERIQPRVQNIVASTLRLDRMISDLLDVSRLGAGRLAIEPVHLDLATLVQRVVAQFTREGDHPIEVGLQDDLPAVWADPGRLEQILENLMSNALKYAEPGTPIVIEASQRDAGVEICVTNTGPGIAAEELPALFTRFHRTGSARGGSVPGLGLGLYITQELVHAHGGRVWVESVPGEETAFHLTLPVRV